jgi:hypothetical protein
MIVERTGAINAYTGDALGRMISQCEDAIGELGG